MTKQVVTPQVGDKVEIGFVSNGNGRLTKSRVKRSDVVKAIYEGTERTPKGVVIYSLQLNNGEQVDVIRLNGGWSAIA
ncbi:hypothetical protein SIPHO035v1_p0067 [Vibrio phage 234P7B]|nr:hypothetical protein SIPHO035v1_p0067 [Vibrio phage 234P7B]